MQDEDVPWSKNREWESSSHFYFRNIALPILAWIIIIIIMLPLFSFSYILSHTHLHTWKDSHDGRLLAGPKGLVPKVPKSLVHLRRNFCRRDSIILSTFNSTRHTVHQMLFICFSAWWDRWIYPALCRPLVDCTAAPWVEEERDARSRVS